MIKKNEIMILGSTGSIGKQTLSVLKKVGDKKISLLTCNKNINLLKKQINDFDVKNTVVFDKDAFEELYIYNKKWKISTKIYCGMDGLLSYIDKQHHKMLINAMVGMIGIKPTINAIKNENIICLANKETLVCAGDIIMPLVKKMGVEIRPIDSEHSAIWQCLQGENISSVKKIIITASGGPFYGKKYNDLKNVKLIDALKHPNWLMGKKITIDSSTLVNKGLEIIEAHHLFNMPYNKIDVVIQRQSIIHSMVEFVDGAVKAQLGAPSMCIPIEYAIYKQNRKFINEKTIDFTKLKNIYIDTPDYKTFKALTIAYKTLKMGGLMPTVFNALNEVAVNKFINNEIKYIDIVKNIEKGINLFVKRKLNKQKFTLSDIDNVLLFAKNVVK